MNKKMPLIQTTWKAQAISFLLLAAAVFSTIAETPRRQLAARKSRRGFARTSDARKKQSSFTPIPSLLLPQSRV
jgi:hypothetical protein